MNRSGLTNQLNMSGSQRDFLDSFGRGTNNIPLTITNTTFLNGAVREVSVTWSAFVCNIAETYYPIAAGTIILNAADVVNPTTYYIYVRLLAGVATVEASATNPETVIAIGYNYSWVAICRFKSNAGTAIVYYLARAAIPMDLFAHFIGEWDYFQTPMWISGGAITIDAASGEVDMGALDYRRLRFEDEILAIVNGSILLDDETTAVANLELVTTYVGGGAVTAGKYHKLLFGVFVSENGTYNYLCMRQTTPTVEYATLAAALADAEHRAASAWPDAYKGRVMPLAYIAMLKADASDLTTVDLRSTGITGGGGGGGVPVADHGLLAGLGDDDHAQYARTDGTRAFTGALDIGGFAIANVGNVDGVDVSVHAADVNAHHNRDHVLASAAALGATHTVAGLAAGQVLRASAAGAANFQALVGADITDFVEVAQDAVGAALLDTTTVNLTYNDGGNTISADVRYQEGLLVVAAGANNDLAIATDFQTIAADPGVAFNITGFALGADGRRLIVFNNTARNMTISNENIGSAAANRILTLGGPAITTGIGIAEFIYSASASRWILLGVHG